METTLRTKRSMDLYANISLYKNTAICAGTCCKIVRHDCGKFRAVITTAGMCLAWKPLPYHQRLPVSKKILVIAVTLEGVGQPIVGKMTDERA